MPNGIPPSHLPTPTYVYGTHPTQPPTISCLPSPTLSWHQPVACPASSETASGKRQPSSSGRMALDIVLNIMGATSVKERCRLRRTSPAVPWKALPAQRTQIGCAVSLLFAACMRAAALATGALVGVVNSKADECAAFTEQHPKQSTPRRAPLQNRQGHDGYNGPWVTREQQLDSGCGSAPGGAGRQEGARGKQ
jgi:hypothetical protein